MFVGVKGIVTLRVRVFRGGAGEVLEAEGDEEQTEDAGAGASKEVEGEERAVV